MNGHDVVRYAAARLAPPAPAITTGHKVDPGNRRAQKSTQKMFTSQGKKAKRY